jgi:lycopene cyclase domain-containing protein
MTYLALNAVFLSLVLSFVVLTVLLVRGRMPWRATGVTMLVTLALTAVFDNVIIGVGLVAYDDRLISGLRIGLAPIEDFAYTVALVMIVSCVSALRQKGRSS